MTQPERLYVTDTVDAEFQFVSEDGRVELTDDFSLDGHTTVTIENEQWTDAFGTDTFYRFEPVVAKPIDQVYHLEDEEYVFRKDEDELKDAQWQIDNLPWTIGHPTGRRVSSTDDIRGFWRNPRYEDGVGQRSHLYIPDNDDEALEFIQDNPSVSVGFGCSLDWDVDDVDAVQRDMLYDHIASVTHGRCSTEDGCGLDTAVADSADVEAHQSERGSEGHASYVSYDAYAVGGCTEGECSCGLHVHDGDLKERTFTDKSVAGVEFEGTRHGKLDRAEIPNDSYESHYLFPEDTKSASDYPVVDGDGYLRRGNVQSAWRLGARGGISGEELDSKLQQLNEAFDDQPIEPSKFNDIDDTMTDSDTDSNNDGQMFALDDMKPEVVIAEHDGVAELVDQKDATIESLKDEKSELESEIEDLREFKDSIEGEERQELVDEITDITDYWSEDEMLGEADDAEPTDVDVLQDRLDALSEVASDETTIGDSADEQTTDSGGDGGDQTDAKYVAGESYDLSNTA